MTPLLELLVAVVVACESSPQPDVKKRPNAPNETALMRVRLRKCVGSEADVVMPCLSFIVLLVLRCCVALQLLKTKMKSIFNNVLDLVLWAYVFVKFEFVK